MEVAHDLPMMATLIHTMSTGLQPAAVLLGCFAAARLIELRAKYYGKAVLHRGHSSELMSATEGVSGSSAKWYEAGTVTFHVCLCT